MTVAKPETSRTRRRASAATGGELATIGMKLSDTGNAERLVARCRGTIRYCPPRKRWLVWSGSRWAWDVRGHVDQLAKQTVRAIYAEAAQTGDEKQREAIVRHALHSEKRERRAALVALAQSEPGIPVLPHELDADPWLFNCANGTIDLRTGALREHSPGDLITKLSPVEFLRGARHELWDRFLADATGGDGELAGYLQRAVGYAMHGRVTEKAFWFLFGPPDGMKSTFIDGVSAGFGDYAVSAAFSTWLVQTSTGGNRGDLVALIGARLVTSVEVRKGARFDEELVKKVTGGDMITAAAKYEAEIVFAPSFALWLAANDAPSIRDDDDGAWSRVRRIPFTHPLPADRRDPQMREKLRASEVQQAILAWAMEGCLASVARSGVGTCAAVEASTSAYRESMDRAAGFFTDCCRFEPGAKLFVAELRTAYEGWCRDNGVRSPLSGKELGARLRARGCEQGKSDGFRVWKGVRLLSKWEEPDAAGAEGQQGHQGSAILESSSCESSCRDSLEQLTLPVPADPDNDVDARERGAVHDEATGGLS